MVVQLKSGKIIGCRDTMMRHLMSRIINPSQYVQEIIDHTNARWEEELICDNFLPMDVAAILSIPSCTTPVRDFWPWHYDRKGLLSVSSAYRMPALTKMRREGWLDSRAGLSNMENEKIGWSTVWKKLKVPSKLKVFVWRLAQFFLPPKDILMRRNNGHDKHLLALR